jgi:hypothetical protein
MVCGQVVHIRLEELEGSLYTKPLGGEGLIDGWRNFSYDLLKGSFGTPSYFLLRFAHKLSISSKTSKQHVFLKWPPSFSALDMKQVSKTRLQGVTGSMESNGQTVTE